MIARARLALFAVVALAVTSAAVPRAAVAEQPLPEYTVKAALLLKIAKFVTWPAAAEGRSDFGICVLGRDPFAGALEPLRSQRLRGRSVAILTVAGSSQVGPQCDLVFIAEPDRVRAAQILAELAGKPLLTIGDAPGFAKAGGIVALQTRNRRVGFEINLAASQRAGLEISSQLLQLATVIDPARQAAAR